MYNPPDSLKFAQPNRNRHQAYCSHPNSRQSTEEYLSLHPTNNISESSQQALLDEQHERLESKRRMKIARNRRCATVSPAATHRFPYWELDNPSDRLLSAGSWGFEDYQPDDDSDEESETPDFDRRSRPKIAASNKNLAPFDSCYYEHKRGRSAKERHKKTSASAYLHYSRTFNEEQQHQQQQYNQQKGQMSPFLPQLVKRKPKLPKFVENDKKFRPPLRKTYSEPTDLYNVDEGDRSNVERIRDILDMLNFSKFATLVGSQTLTGEQRTPGVSNYLNPVQRNHMSLNLTKIPTTEPSDYYSKHESAAALSVSPPDEIWATPRGSISGVVSDSSAYYETETGPQPTAMYGKSNLFGPGSISASGMTKCAFGPGISGQLEAEFWPRSHFPGNSGAEFDSGSTGTASPDFLASAETNIMELKDAAQTIEAIARRSRRRASAKGTTGLVGGEKPKEFALSGSERIERPKLAIKDTPATPTTTTSSLITGLSASLPQSSSVKRSIGGITARLGGQPRGVMQFLPSLKTSELLLPQATPVYETYLTQKRKRQMAYGMNKSLSVCDSSSVANARTPENPPNLTPFDKRSGDKGALERGGGHSVLDSDWNRENRLEEEVNGVIPNSAWLAPRGSLPIGLAYFPQELQTQDRPNSQSYANKITQPSFDVSHASTSSPLPLPNFLFTPASLEQQRHKSKIENSDICANRRESIRSSEIEFDSLGGTSLTSGGENDLMTGSLGGRYSFREPAFNGGTTERPVRLTRQRSQQNKYDPFDQENSGDFALRGVDSLGSFNRFGRLLRALRLSHQNSPELVGTTEPGISPAGSESPTPSSSSMSPYNRRYAVVDRANYGRHDRNAQDDSAYGQSPRSTPSTAAVVPPPLPSQQQQPYANLALLTSGHLWPSPRSTNQLTPLSRSPAQIADGDLSIRQAGEMLWKRRSRGSLRRHEDTRTHIVRELYDTESSYVDNLQLIVHKYLRPLKRPELCSLMDASLVDEIFFQIPEILGHHELFFAALKSRLDNWDSRQKIGDIILNNFTKQSMIDTYTAFINNWRNAKQAIRAACQAKPAFAKYLERCSREHKNKLALDALLIMPVQRIPRYELLIKELLKHTSVEHPDHPLLLRAQKEIHDLATKINHVEQEVGLSEQMLQRLREIEAIVDGLDDLVSPSRTFYRYDLVTLSSQSGKKERCMFLFSDQLIITNVKKKSSTTLRKLSSINIAAPSNFLESNKFKLLMKISLDDAEIAKSSVSLLTRLQEESTRLHEDMEVLNTITGLARLLNQNRGLLEKVDRLKDDARHSLIEKQQEIINNPALSNLELLITTESGIESLKVSFQSPEKQVEWEKSFTEAKEALISSASQRTSPLFLKTIAVQRTRAGLQFSCAAPTIGRNEYGYPDVWVCNSDGYVGQVGVVNLTPEPDLTCCNGITNSRILCICAVPSAKLFDRQKQKSVRLTNVGNETVTLHSDAAAGKSPRMSITLTGSQGQLEENKDEGQMNNLELESDSSDNESSVGVPVERSGHTKAVGSGVGITSLDDNLTLKSNPSHQSMSAESDTNVSICDNVPTMWLGTEDGCIHMFNYNESVRNRKNKTSVQHGSAVTSIIYTNERVFVSLASGSVLYYERENGNSWKLDTFKWIDTVSEMGTPAPLLYSSSRIWCGFNNKLCILEANSLRVEHSAVISNDNDCSVGCVSSSGLSVWMSVQCSPILKLFHAHHFNCLLEVNVMPSVTKILAGCDDIIRQHKISRLRITALLCCKDLVWIGTSAGVILHLPIPHVTHNTARVTNIPSFSAASVGHSGLCRFLTSVELGNSGPTAVASPTSKTVNFSATDWRKRRMSLNVANLQQGKVYVMSGGDGFEDFQDLSTDEGDERIGREDNTNHVIVWQV